MYIFLEIVVFCLAVLYAYSVFKAITNAIRCIDDSEDSYSVVLKEGFSKSYNFGFLAVLGIVILNIINVTT